MRTAGLLLVMSQILAAQGSECYRRIGEDFTPATLSERLAEAARSVAGPSVLAYTALRAAGEEAAAYPAEWRQGTAGYARRFGSIYAEHFIAETFEQSIALGLHEDVRYFGSSSHSRAARLGYALASPLFTRHDDGSFTPAIGAIGGAAGSAMISRAWQPRSSNSMGDAAISFGLQMGFRALWNTLREFAPGRLGVAVR
jgi:hypothetical protein